ncbi:CLUMA_CG005017, isoform A [Clunio marinus]|uniref:CLUMA_CG005017, isoform A n=1 Tax=Clunio marinus TaxID=568069 RepID=A0A1J1HTE7_9DIPT|nr:CLUMA_CG005017, isoform A [Clunio marinus]
MSNSLASALKQGQKINYDRCHSKLKSVKPLHDENKEVEDEVKIRKILYPSTRRKYPKCCHQNDFVLSRENLSSEDYLNFLSKPKKRVPEGFPRWIEKKIPPCTNLINSLAHPKMHKLLETFQTHLHHLSIFEIESFLKKMFEKDYLTPEEVFRSTKQTNIENKVRAQRRLKKMKKLCRRIECQSKKEEQNYIKNIIEKLTCSTLNQQESHEPQSKLTEDILTQICLIMKQKVPQKNSHDLIGQIFYKLANKIASSLEDLITESGFKIISSNDNFECDAGKRKNCLEIVQYQSEVSERNENESETKEYESEEDTESDEDSDGEFDQSKDNQNDELEEIERKISFLNNSQVNFDVDECRELLNKAEALLAAIAKRAEGKAARKAKRDAVKKAKKKNKGGMECLGNVNRKPQWQVEWSEKK